MRISLVSEQKSGHMILTEKGPTRKGNVSIATKLSHFLFLFTLVVFLWASSGIFATEKKDNKNYLLHLCS